MSRAFEEHANATFAKIPLNNDLPIQGDSDSDLLGTGDYARLLAGTALGTEGPFTIGVFGGWGHGKTSLLKQTQSLVRDEWQSSIITVWFNAWQYEREQYPLFPLIAAIVKNIEEHIRKHLKLSGPLRRWLHWTNHALQAVAHAAIFETKGNDPEPPNVKVGLERLRMVNHIEELTAHNNRFDTQLVYQKAYSTLEHCAEHYAQLGGRIIVFIDDLDRCSPEKALGLLESIKLVLGQPGFIFLLGLDHDILLAFLTKRYKEQYGVVDEEEAKRLAQTYLEKIVQMQFDIPRHESQFSHYLEELINRRKSEHTLFAEIDAILKTEQRSFGTMEVTALLAAGSDYNPRTLTRLLNSLVVDYRLWLLLCRPKWQAEETRANVLLCILVAHMLRKHLGSTVTRRLTMNRELCEALQHDVAAATVLDDSEQHDRTCFPAKEIELEELEQKIRDCERVYSLLRGPGMVWLQEHDLREQIYGFYRKTDVRWEAPESQKSIFHRAVRQALGLKRNEKITSDHLKEVTVLNLNGESDFNDGGMRLIAGLTELRTIGLWGTRITDEGLEYLKGLSRLRQLNLRQTRVTGRGFVYLKNLPSLEGIDLRETEVCTAGMKNIAGLKNLVLLHLCDTYVNDDDLAFLKNLPKLEELSLRNTQVTGDGIEYFRKQSNIKRLSLSEYKQHRQQSKTQ